MVNITIISHGKQKAEVLNAQFVNVFTKRDDSDIPSLGSSIIRHAQNNNMQINPKKTKEMVINFTKEAITQPLTINGESVECVHEIKLLGLWINDRLNWNTHAEDIYAKAAKRLYTSPSAITKGGCESS